ncbi:hypothetical protein M407DRAFT_19524, partial [Tulasnella calospora MUT 4182]
MAVSGTATHRHAPHLNSSTTSSSSLSLTTRLANFMGFQSRHQQSPRTPPDQGVDHDPWIAVPQPQASTSSFGAGTLRSIRTIDGTAGGGGGHYGVSAFSSEEGGSSYLQPHQQPAVGAGLSPYLAVPNAFAKQQQQQQQHINTSQAPPPPRSSSPWGDSGSSFSSPIEPARTGGFFRTASTSGHSTSAAPPAPSTSKVSPLKQRLRTSGLFPTSSSSSS